MSDEPLRLLVSFAHWSNAMARTIEKYKGEIEWVLDSGAFTSWRGGRTINLDDYHAFIRDLPVPPLFYFMLDVIGDAEGTRQNYRRSLDAGFRPVPIFTRGESLDRIDELYQTTEVLGIGSLVRTTSNRGFLRAVMERIEKRPVHWLGFSRPDFLGYYKPFSVDSAGWASGLLYGQLRVYRGLGRFRTVSRKDFAERPSRELLALIESLGVDPRTLTNDAAWRNIRLKPENATPMQRVTYASAIRHQEDAMRILGVRVFLVVTNDDEVEHMINARRALGLTGRADG